MAIDLTKVPLLSHIQYLYGDIRDRIKEKYSKPEEGIPASDLAPGVIPDIGLIENGKAPIIMETASGNPIVITDGAAGLPLSECKLTLLPRQSGSGDASPENVRPLVPWENVGMWHFPENQLVINAVERTTFGITFTPIKDSNNKTVAIHVEGTVEGSNVFCNLNYSEGKLAFPVGAYKVSGYTSKVGLRVYAIKNGVDTKVYDSASQTEFAITDDMTQAHMRIQIYADIGESINETIYPIVVKEGESITPYSVDLTGITSPVYGCEIDLTTGEVWGTHVEKVYTGAQDENWAKGGNDYFVCIQEDCKKGRGIFPLCDKFTMEQTYAATYCIRPIESKDYASTVEEWRSWLSANHMQVVYELTEPVLLATLTPQEIETLLGLNTIWSDADSIDIEYRADTELFINQNGVKDVQINGTSVMTGGVANVPKGGPDQLGVFKTNTNFGIITNTNGELKLSQPSDAQIKAGTNNQKPIVPENQHKSAFYALAKLAGADMAQSSNAVGTYTDAAKQGIQKMLGLDGLVGPYEADITADQPYAIGDTFVMDGKRYKATAAIAQGGVITPGTNCELDPLDGRYVKDTDYATNQKAGVVKVQPSEGLAIYDSSKILYVNCADSNTIKAEESYTRAIVPRYQYAAVFYGLAKAAGEDMKTSSNPIGTYTAEAKAAILAMLGANGNGLQILNGTLATDSASTTSIKNGGNSYAPIVSSHVHDAAFFGLAKAAGVDLATVQDVVVGVYPQNAKDAIQSMLGIEADIPLVETVSGTTPSITGMPNVRYVCGEVSLLTITPPASGSIVVRFSSGSTATVLTVPNTVKFPAWFDPTDLEANTTYELIITDGVYGGAMAWAD